MKLYNTCMGLIDIKNISGDIILSILPNGGCKRKFTLMKEDYITLKFSLDNPIYFKLGSYVECEFGLFEVCDLQKPIFNANTGGYDYELQLGPHYWKWKNKVFKYTPETAGQEASWNLTASLDVQAGIVLRNLKALGYKYKGQDFVFSIDSTVENKALLMTYDNINILDACFEMAKKWDCECWVTENIIHFGRCESGDAVNFEIGVNVVEMSRSDSQSTYATRIYAFGSTRNIPSNYRPVDESVVVNGVVQKRLMLPDGTPYIDAYPDMTTEEAIEQVVIFDEVYPRRVGTMSDVTTIEVTDKVENEDGTTTEEKWNAYRFKDTGITFSKDYILSGEELKIIFQSGKLNGMEFAVTFDPDNKNEQLWEIVRNENYGRPLPDGVLIPENGDTYILSGWDSTKIAELGLVSSAEQELKDKAEKYVAKSKIDPNTYNCMMMSDVAYSEDGVHNLYGIGQKVNLINKAYFENGRQSRVIGYEFNLDFPYDSPIYTVGETAAYSRIGDLEGKIESLTLKGQTYTGGWGSGVYLIKRNDSTPATDNNAFSALRSLSMFLRKDKDDRTPHKLSSDKAFEIGKFVSGSTGGIIMVDKETGQTYAEVDKLKVRMKAYFESLEIQNVNSVGGKIVLTPGGAVTLIDVWTKGTIEQTPILSMADGNPILLADGSELQLMDKETVDNGVPEGVYRCFFLAEQDGVEVENRFRAGFQVQSKNFNIQKPGEYQQVANHYYWRLCVGASKEPINVGIYKLHYIDLSMADCDTGSDIPAKGDTVAHLGARIKWKGIDNKDVTDASNIDAQNAIVFSSTDVFSPSVTLYHGIDSYSYLNKEYVEYGVDKTNNKAFFHVYGDAYIGDRDGNSFVKFTQGEGVELKGKLHIQEGSTGSANLTDLPDEIYNAVQIGNENLLLNSGFTGDYDSIDISESTQMQADTEVYSPKIKYWEGDANIVEDSEAVSGYRADIGYLSQEVNLMLEEQYVISLRAKGTSLTVGYGDYNSTESLDDTYKKYVYKFTCRSLGVFFISGKASVCDIKLERGTIPTDWCPSRLDTDKSADRFKYLQYIQDAIKDGSVDILGGLILANMIQLGNYKNGKLQKVTAGISGIYNDDDDVAFWAGGKLEQAIMTVMKFRNDPNYQPTDAEWANMANFVATHGGDVFLKGYVYALGGFFRGRVETSVDGKRIVIDPEKNTLEMYTAEGHATLILRFDKSSDEWEYGDLILRKYVNDQLALETTVYPERIRIQNHVEKTDIMLNPNNVSFYGSKGETLLVGMKSVYNGVNVSKYVADISCSHWPGKDDVSTGQVYVDYETVEGIITNGILKVKK